MQCSERILIGATPKCRGLASCFSFLDISRGLPYSAAEPCFVTAPTRILPSLAVVRNRSAASLDTGNERKDMPR